MTDREVFRVHFIAHLIQGEFTEYHIKVSSSRGESWLIRRRYREFRDLHDHLKLKYGENLPQIPGKRLWGNQDPSFVQERQEGLQRYLDGVLALEPDCSTKYLRRFLEIRDQPRSPTAVAPATATTIDEKKNVFKTCQEALFDLSASPTLIDPAEAEQLRLRYAEIWRNVNHINIPCFVPATMTSSPTVVGESIATAGDILAVFAE